MASNMKPHTDIRSAIANLDSNGQLLRFSEVDQDRYEATAILYNLIEEKGLYNAPAVWFDRVKINGRWMDGPVVANLFGNVISESLAFGINVETSNANDMYSLCVRDLAQCFVDGKLPKIPPREVNAAAAPCKQVVLRKSEADLSTFPWLKLNPADAGQYINAGALLVNDPELGGNLGVYRCQVKGDQKIGVNVGRGQDAYPILMGMKERGIKAAQVALVQGMDPVTWSLAATKIGGKGDYELELAGSLLGQPLDVVKCETSDLLVPAQAEMIIEGKISLEDFEEEGPFGEFLGFQGPKKPNNFVMHVDAITHRESPWFYNAFSGITFDMPHSIWASQDQVLYEGHIPNYVDTFRPAAGVIVLRIDKHAAGAGLEAGKILLAQDPYAKVIIVVDKDVNTLESEQVLWALGSMWQPYPATYIKESMKTGFTDPSSPERFVSSRIVIDATRQLPEEGGPQVFAPTNRSLLEKESPNIILETKQKWSHLWK